jgi:hypothetical protein
MPKKTQIVRVVMLAEQGGRMGAADIDRKTIDAARANPTPGSAIVSIAVCVRTPRILSAGIESARNRSDRGRPMCRKL